MKTARMTILLPPEDKAAIHARALSFGISAGELVRRAVESYGNGRAAGDADAESEMVLNALADELFAAAAEARAALAQANVEVQATVKQLSKRRGAARVRL
jgi:hypothetical protein